MAIPSETIEQIAAGNDIVEVIGSYFPLKRAGANFKALCPFHQEKTPSFMVSPSRQTFHCFGCGAGGSVFRFVMDYEHVDPIPDIQTCWRQIRAFAIKDHRWTPKNEDCGPGLGAIDHYKLLEPVRQTGLDMPLACENIFEPSVPRPTDPEKVDALARRARVFLEKVVNKS